eukprot:TRINITY_DN9082_c0_g1_i1.p1 TRINITY_DN9082_c0_g1~~TRINITY_DN9082_c0_g1_i1.p1  ORF type:complete len:231 (+),score=19.72 TRINITY_DN9082_c0_g1_i1:75-695(+)
MAPVPPVVEAGAAAVVAVTGVPTGTPTRGGAGQGAGSMAPVPPVVEAGAAAVVAVTGIPTGTPTKREAGRGAGTMVPISPDEAIGGKAVAADASILTGTLTTECIIRGADATPSGGPNTTLSASGARAAVDGAAEPLPAAYEDKLVVMVLGRARPETDDVKASVEERGHASSVAWLVVLTGGAMATWAEKKEGSEVRQGSRKRCGR